MIRYLSLEELLELHRLVLQQTGGLESAVAQPQMTFGGEDLYPCLPTKAPWGSRWYATIRSSMATSELVIWRWKCSWFSTVKSSSLKLMNKSVSLFDLQRAS